MSSGAASRPWVLDTSVAASWFLGEEQQHADALRVLSAVQARPDPFVVPHLIHAELIHVLSRRWGRDVERVRLALTLFVSLGIRVLPLTGRALDRSARWACSGLTGYDATFVALAEDVGGRWLTADEHAAGIAGKLAAPLGRWRVPARRSSGGR